MSDGNLPDRVPLFSRHKPRLVKDWQDRGNKLRDYSKQILLDPFSQGVLRNVLNELEVTIDRPSDPDTDALVDSGAAWLFDSSDVGLGQRIEVPTQQAVVLNNPAVEDNIVYVKFKETDADYKPDYITGDSTPTEKQGGYELGAVAETSWPVANAMPLARVGLVGADIVVKEDLRQFFILKAGYSEASKELNVGFLLPVFENALACDDLFAVFQPALKGGMGRIVIESLYAAMPVGGIDFEDEHVYIGVWDDSDKVGKSVWVDIGSLVQGGVAVNEIGGTIGGMSMSPHRFNIGFQVDDPSTLGILVDPPLGYALVTLTIRYRMA